MIKKLVLIILLLSIILIVFIFLPQEKEVIIEEELKDLKELEEIVLSFIGTPYKLGPLGEKEDKKLYREDVFDCTTLVLISVSKFLSDEPQEMIKKINYFPAGEVSYENRLHFSSYRNKVSDYFKDITQKVGGSYTKSKTISLNKDRLIDIEWQKDIVLDYILVENVEKIIDKLPSLAGVMFMREEDKTIGLDVRHEGFLIDRKDLVHASINSGKVIKENFLNYLEKVNYDGVIFYEIVF